MRASHLAVAALTGLLAWRFDAAAATTIHRARGSILSVSPQQIVVSSLTGDSRTFAITPQTRYATERKLALSAIQPGSYIGSAAIPGGNGTLTALEVTVFPPSMKGAGEGHRDWDLAPHSSMTNGTVGALKQANGDVLTVTYHGGTQIIVVPPGTPIVAPGPGNYDALQPGMKVIVFPSPKDPKVADRIAYGEDGLTPPQ
ncbi:hypothetical protein ACELLULO517_04485 [Acidisoma cellulosilytica]|uniref:DUF5666 domain-containing protein n=1 Tax=Acidisoma cellulosilyticum TaxID=2802395 RepID=A0A964E2M7_9PROT|nr:hypothetical protein [Acidisoma cellulosilyticum]MCB8879479.1 hypothetical protein [Acidisoma cellulosilyticum]